MITIFSRYWRTITKGLIALDKKSDKKSLHHSFYGQSYEETKMLIISFVLAYVIFQIAFYKESFFNILKILAAFYWLYVLPGVAILINFREQFDFKVRLVLGTAVGLGIYAVLSYYIGIFGLNVKYHWIVIPPLIVLSAIWIVPFIFASIIKKGK